MSYRTSNAEGPVDFINTYDLEPMAQQVIPKASFGYIASGAEDTFTLRENIRELLTTNSLFLIRFVMWKTQAQRLYLMVKNYLHQSLWHLLQPIN